jgi:hypothetical protein
MPLREALRFASALVSGDAKGARMPGTASIESVVDDVVVPRVVEVHADRAGDELAPGDGTRRARTESNVRPATSTTSVRLFPNGIAVSVAESHSLLEPRPAEPLERRGVRIATRPLSSPTARGFSVPPAPIAVVLCAIAWFRSRRDGLFWTSVGLNVLVDRVRGEARGVDLPESARPLAARKGRKGR